MPNDDGKHFVVKYQTRKPRDENNLWEYTPDGESYECTREQAMARFEVLVAAGKLGVPVFGIVPFRVRIEDTTLPEPKDCQPAWNVMLSQYASDDYALGPWASERAAA